MTYSLSDLLLLEYQIHQSRNLSSILESHLSQRSHARSPNEFLPREVYHQNQSTWTLSLLRRYCRRRFEPSPMDNMVDMCQYLVFCSYQLCKQYSYCYLCCSNPGSIHDTLSKYRNHLKNKFLNIKYRLLNHHIFHNHVYILHKYPDQLNTTDPHYTHTPLNLQVKHL